MFPCVPRSMPTNGWSSGTRPRSCLRTTVVAESETTPLARAPPTREHRRAVGPSPVRLPVLCGEFMTTGTVRPSPHRRRGVAPLGDRVRHVVELRAQEQVKRLAARRVVTGVTDVKIAGIAVHKGPRVTVGQNGRRRDASPLKCAVASVVAASGPLPAARALVEFEPRPEVGVRCEPNQATRDSVRHGRVIPSATGKGTHDRVG